MIGYLFCWQPGSGGNIEIRGFGSFSVREYGGCHGRDPKSGQQIESRL
ncbi:MAG: hypothetical protein HIU83_16190 [Proteobacteria bacterium]|nr:hypothetical protein [Pseudomonadota bacterium]